jgi:hypothetical protein
MRGKVVGLVAAAALLASAGTAGAKGPVKLTERRGNAVMVTKAALRRSIR